MNILIIMEQTTGIGSIDANIMKLLAKLTEKAANHVYSLHVLREAVTAEGERHRTEEILLRDLEKENAKTVSKEKSARTDESVSCHQYEIQSRELKREMDEHREAAIIAEVNSNLLAAVQDQITQKEIELAELRRDKQWKSQSDGSCASAGVNLTIANRTSIDLEQISRSVEQAKKEMKKLTAKRAEASKITSEVRAYILTEKNAKLEMGCRVKAAKYAKPSESNETAISKPGQVRLREPAPSQKQTSRLAILKELEEERMCGGNLTKELTELTQRALEKASKRKRWLEKQFPKDDEIDT